MNELADIIRHTDEVYLPVTAALIQLSNARLRTEVEGMIAFNQYRKYNGLALAYGEDAFTYAANKKHGRTLRGSS